MQTGNRRRLFVLTSSFLLVALFLMVQFAVGQGAQATTFSGEITDEHLNCIQTPVKAPAGITHKEACILYWAHFEKPPSKYVLYDAANKKTYQLDDQDWVQPYVAQKVQITGTLNPATSTIHVTGIKKP
jgi:hypothetical protein